MLLKSFFYFIIFAGSVFLTSGKFVNTTNTPKLYFVLISLLITAVIIAINRKRLNFHALKSKVFLWGMNIICFLQACYGLFQYAGWFPSNHSQFPITGSFDNPAGFAAVLSIGYPIGIFLFTKAKNNERFLAALCLVVITIAIFISGSRAGVLAILFSSGAYLLIRINVIIEFQQLIYYKLLSRLILCLFVGGASILYYQKNDSANGRLLIWEVSSEMIKAKPLFGHGYDSFQAKYMDYQAEYFKRNTNSRFEQGMSGNSLLVDTNILIYLFKGNERVYELLY
jgi:O-antigen polymerase